MEKLKKITKNPLFYGITSVLIMGFIFLFAFGGNESGSAYLINSTNNAVTDTITTAGDSADASYTFENKDNKWKYLIVEYIQAAAPVKSLVVAGDNVYGLKMTYDEADSTLKLWSQRQLGWVQLGFYVQTTSAETQTNTLARVTSANDTVSGTGTLAGTETGTITVTSNDTTTGIITIASNDTLAGTITLAHTETWSGTVSANDTLSGTVTTMANDTITGAVAVVSSDTSSVIVTGTGQYTNDSIRVIDVEGTHTYTLVNDGSGTDTYSLVNDVLQTYALLNTVAGTHTYALVNDVEGTETYVLIADVEGTQTYALVQASVTTYALINDGSGTVTGTESIVISKTDPNTIVYEIAVTPDSGTSTCIFTVRGTNYLVGY